MTTGAGEPTCPWGGAEPTFPYGGKAQEGAEPPGVGHKGFGAAKGCPNCPTCPSCPAKRCTHAGRGRPSRAARYASCRAATDRLLVSAAFWATVAAAEAKSIRVVICAEVGRFVEAALESVDTLLLPVDDVGSAFARRWARICVSKGMSPIHGYER